MSIYIGGNIKEITPFSEVWYDPLDNSSGDYSSLMDHRPYAQLVRAMQNWEIQLGQSQLPDESLWSYLGDNLNPLTNPLDITGEYSDSNFLYIDENDLPQGHYINAHRNILTGINNKLKRVAIAYSNDFNLNSYVGYDSTTDFINNLITDSTNTFLTLFYNSAEIWTVNSNFPNILTGEFINPIYFNYRQYWGRIIKTFQECIDNINKYKEIKYAGRFGSINISYENNSTEFNGPIFWLNQRTDHVNNEYIDTTIYCDQRRVVEIYPPGPNPSYVYPGITNFNECDDVVTSYDSTSFMSLGVPTEVVTTLLGSDHRNREANSQDYWVRSGFAGVKNTIPYGTSSIFPRVYSIYDNFDCDDEPDPANISECLCFTDYNYYQNRIYQAYLKDIGWCGNTHCKKSYNVTVGVSGTIPNINWQFENPPTIKILAQWSVIPSVYPNTRTWTGNEWVHVSKNQTQNVSLEVTADGDYYLSQDIFPLPTNSLQRFYGGGVRRIKYLYYLNGLLLGNETGNNFYVYISPGNKFYVSTENLN